MPEYITANLTPLSSVRISNGITVEIDEDNHIIIESKESNQNIETSPEEVSLPLIWNGISFLELQMQLVSGECKGKLFITGVKRSLSFDWEINDETNRLVFPLKELQLATEAHDAFRVKQIIIKTESIGAFQLLGIKLTSETKNNKEILIDSYGQRVCSDWPSKISEAAHFDERKTLEPSKPTPPHAVSKYGGWKTELKFSGSGYFKLGKTSSGRWWLIDPDGYPFWSFGIGHIGLDLPTMETLYTGREHIFDSAVKQHTASSKVNHYKVNCLLKYGSKEAWFEKQKDRLKHWGINTIGTQSENPLFLESTHPIIVSLPVVPDYSNCMVDCWPDIFCPNWQEWFQESVPELVMQWMDTDNLLAYQIGRYLPWTKARILDSESDSALKMAWRDFMKEKYDDISAFNQTWQSAYTSWDELLTMSELNIPQERNKAEQDKETFLLYYAKEYFTLLSNLLTSLDEKHLLMGPCFGPDLPTEEILKLAGQHFDVICWLTGREALDVNIVEKVNKLTGRPILLCGGAKERHSEGRLMAHTCNHTPKALAHEYRNDISEALKLPYVLGYHFDSLVDDPISGRLIDDERRNVGIVDITDSPYPQSIETLRSVSSNMYEERLKAN